VFETFKFIGRMDAFEGNIELPLPEVLRRMNQRSTAETEIIGLVVPGQGSVVLDGHRVLSDGDRWCKLDDVFKAYEAPLISP
jgi:hypothetical protein